MNSYQVFLAAVLVTWPLMIFALLFVMSRMEDFVNRSDAATPKEAGLEPVEGHTGEREVQIRFGDQVVGESSK